MLIDQDKGVFFFVSCSNAHGSDMKGYDIIYKRTTRLHYCCWHELLLLGVGRVESTNSFPACNC